MAGTTIAGLTSVIVKIPPNYENFRGRTQKKPVSRHTGQIVLA